MSSSPVAMGTGTWNVRASSTMDVRDEEDTINLPTYKQPTFSKMLELDISRNRQPDTLLGTIKGL